MPSARGKAVPRAESPSSETLAKVETIVSVYAVPVVHARGVGTFALH